MILTRMRHGPYAKDLETHVFASTYRQSQLSNNSIFGAVFSELGGHGSEEVRDGKGKIKADSRRKYK